MLASGAHVKIGDKEFRLDFGSEGAYSYSLTPTGSETLFWLWDDWSGGEGNDSYDPLDEIVYHQGNVNPRVPGKLTTPPTRGTLTATGLSRTPSSAFTAVANGRLWVIGENVTSSTATYRATSNFSTFGTSITDNSWNASVNRIHAVCSDGTYVYLVGSNTSDGDYQIRRISPDGSTMTQIRNYANGNAYPMVGAAVKGKYIYTWNGNAFRERNTEESSANTGNDYDRVIFQLGSNLSGMTWGTDWWGNLINGEDSLFFFFATEGRTVVLERGPSGAVSEIWNLPSGFTGKDITYQSGALIVVGEYLNNAAAFGMSTISRQPIFLGFLRLGTDISPEIVGTGFGTEVIMAERDASSTGGRIFIYDIGYDAFSQLDSISVTSGEIWSAGTFRDKRYVALENGTDLSLYFWDTDDEQSTSVNGRCESGAWDFDLPEDEKQLDGIHVLSNAGSGSPAADYEVFYQDNEDGTWTSAGTGTSGFHNYHQVSTGSSTVKFRTLRVRIDPKDGCEIYAVSVRVRVNTYQETWELLLDMTDEAVDQSRGRRRRSHEDRGWQLRDYLRDIADNKTVVTFLDGAKYPQGEGDDPDKYTTHTVNVEVPFDRLERPGEGIMLVRLTSVDTN